MVKLIYLLPPPDWRGDVINSGKPEDQRERDLKVGVARLGGSSRQPSYQAAYIHAARQLVADAVEQGALDELALPIFYLQRHATELILKRLLAWLYETADYRSRAGWTQNAIAEKQKKRQWQSHTLGELLADLQQTANLLEFPAPPHELSALVEQFSRYEITETWARYPMSPTRKPHLPNETEVPIVEIQAALELTSSCITYSVDDPWSYENVLYEGWLDVARHLGIRD
jgi:hypothetical protein